MFGLSTPPLLPAILVRATPDTHSLQLSRTAVTAATSESLSPTAAPPTTSPSTSTATPAGIPPVPEQTQSTDSEAASPSDRNMLPVAQPLIMSPPALADSTEICVGPASTPLATASLNTPTGVGHYVGAGQHRPSPLATGTDALVVGDSHHAGSTGAFLASAAAATPPTDSLGDSPHRTATATTAPAKPTNSAIAHHLRAYPQPLNARPAPGTIASVRSRISACCVRVCFMPSALSWAVIGALSLLAALTLGLAGGLHALTAPAIGWSVGAGVALAALPVLAWATYFGTIAWTPTALFFAFADGAIFIVSASAITLVLRERWAAKRQWTANDETPPDICDAVVVSSHLRRMDSDGVETDAFHAWRGSSCGRQGKPSNQIKNPGRTP